MGNFVLMLHCASEDPAHQLLGHVAVGLLLFIVIGAYYQANKPTINARHGPLTQGFLGQLRHGATIAVTIR